MQIDTAVFSYEPVLHRLQDTKAIELKDELLCWEKGVPMQLPPSPPIDIIRGIEAARPTQDLRSLLGTQGKPIVLDPAQTASLLMGLRQRVSLIQGPPGTEINIPPAINGLLNVCLRYGKVVSWCSDSQGLVRCRKINLGSDVHKSFTRPVLRRLTKDWDPHFKHGSARKNYPLNEEFSSLGAKRG